MNSKSVGLVVIVVMVVCASAIGAGLHYSVEEIEDRNNRIKAAALEKLPDNASIERLCFGVIDDYGWIEVEAWYSYSIRQCSEYEREYEPWKCENDAWRSGMLIVWYNTRTGEIYCE